MSAKRVFRFKCTKTKCWIEYDVMLHELSAQPCPKCNDTEFVEVKETSGKVNPKELDNYGYGY